MKLRWRILQIDLARQKENIEFVKSYANFAKKSGYNALFLYLENAVRTESTSFFSEEETYSKQEMKEIVDYVESIGLEVIPAFETLGHLEKFFAYPELLPLAEKDESVRGRRLSEPTCCGCVSNPQFYSFLNTYIGEVCEIFGGQYIHVGLDETFDFAVCDDCQKRIKNGEPIKELFYQHVIRIYEICKKLGKTMMMWDDFFEYMDIVDRLPRDIVMCNWNYMFVGDEPGGHWTNRIKKNWFALYDELGFEYIFCTYAHRASSTYAIDSFTDYAEQYNPIGALMTSWCRQDSFYQGSYPCVLYSAKRWTGEAKKEDKTKIYAEFFAGNEDCAQLIANLNIVDSCGFGNVTKICECDYLVKWVYRDSLVYVLPKLKEYAKTATGELKDVLTDIYDHTLEQYLGLQMQRVGVDYFDRKNKLALLEVIELVKEGYNEIKLNGDILWRKYRQEIKSSKDSFNRKYANKQILLNKIKTDIESEKEFGVLYLDLMLPESYSTVRCKAEVEYENGERETLCDGQMKSTAVTFECGGCYHYRLATKPVNIKRLLFSVYGEGALYPTHFRYSLNGNVYVASDVKTINGHVVNAEKILRDDTRFAEMGYDDGVAHIENLSLSKIMHTIEVSFTGLT